jgi:hypothetical protein
VESIKQVCLYESDTVKIIFTTFLNTISNISKNGLNQTNRSYIIKKVQVFIPYTKILKE